MIVIIPPVVKCNGSAGKNEHFSKHQVGGNTFVAFATAGFLDFSPNHHFKYAVDLILTQIK